MEKYGNLTFFQSIYLILKVIGTGKSRPGQKEEIFRSELCGKEQVNSLFVSKACDLAHAQRPGCVQVEQYPRLINVISPHERAAYEAH